MLPAVNRLSAVIVLLVLPAFAAKLPDVQQVTPAVYRGCQPTAEGIVALAKMGIRTIVDLRGGWIHAPHEKRLVQNAGMRYIAAPLSGFFAPSDTEIAKILAVLEDPGAAPVFVHCKRGADRVGLVIACYRMVHDHWSNQQALSDARAHRLSPFEVLMAQYLAHFHAERVRGLLLMQSLPGVDAGGAVSGNVVGNLRDGKK